MAGDPGLRVFFVVDGARYSLGEHAATALGEDLRRGASGSLGDQGYEAAALTVADAIEDVLVGAADDPIEIEPEEAEAVFYLLDSAGDAHRGDLFKLYRAVRRAHQTD
jgi:hypothetical protein